MARRYAILTHCAAVIKSYHQVNTLSKPKLHKLYYLQLAKQSLRRFHQTVSLKLVLHMDHHSPVWLYQLRCTGVAESCFFATAPGVQSRKPDDAAISRATTSIKYLESSQQPYPAPELQHLVAPGNDLIGKTYLHATNGTDKANWTDCHSQTIQSKPELTIEHCNESRHTSDSRTR